MFDSINMNFSLATMNRIVPAFAGRPIMRRFPWRCCVWCIVCMTLCFFSVPTFAWNQLPLFAESPQVLPAGQLQFGIGAQFLNRKNFYFSPSSRDFSRNVMAFPVLDARFSLGGYAELQLMYEVLSVEEKETNIQEDWTSGDLAFFTKMQLWQEQRVTPGLGIKVGAKLPNADETRRIGTDEADIALLVLAEKSVPRLTLQTHVGLLILGDPFSKASQDDLLSYAVACRIAQGKQLRYSLEIAGQTLGVKHNEQAVGVARVSFLRGAFTFHLATRAGLLKNSEDWGVSGGIQWILDL